MKYKIAKTIHDFLRNRGINISVMEGDFLAEEIIKLIKNDNN
jgi:hypothetical protein